MYFHPRECPWTILIVAPIVTILMVRFTLSPLYAALPVHLYYLLI
jgi:hypothetical protein